MNSNKAMGANIYLCFLLNIAAIQAIAKARWRQTEPISICFDTPVIIAPSAIIVNSMFSTILKMSLITLFVFIPTCLEFRFLLFSVQLFKAFCRKFVSTDYT